MQPVDSPLPPQEDLFRQQLDNLLNSRHELLRLAQQIPWAPCVERFGPLYADRGRPGLPIRLLVGLQYLKHLYVLPIDPSQMTRFRQRIGEGGCEWLLQLTIEVGLATKTIQTAHLRQVSVDTTVQPKAVAFPTDARLYLKGLRTLVREAKRAGLVLRQSYTRLAAQAFLQHGRYAKAKQMKRARRMQKKLKMYLGRVYRDVKRKLTTLPELQANFQNLLSRLDRLLSQQRQDKQKLYSVHAPEVECLAKGKAHKPYEFGVKVSVATTQTRNFIVGMQALAGTPYDGHTLVGQLEQVKRLTGQIPSRCVVDQGYRGHGIEPSQTEILISRQRRSLTRALKRVLRRRNAIEPIIGHMKEDGWLGRNHLKGNLGDKLNALLCGVGQNLRAILRHLRIFWLQFVMRQETLSRVSMHIVFYPA